MSKTLHVLLAGLCMALAGCTASAGTPTQAVSKFYSALAAQDYETAFAMVSSEQRDRLARELDELSKPEGAAGLARNNEAYGLNLSASDVSGMSPQEFWKTLLAAAINRDAGLRAMLATVPAIDTSAEGGQQDTADIQVTFTTGRVKIEHCVREGSNWRVKFSP